MSIAKKRIIWGVVWLLAWPVWFWVVALTGIGSSPSGYKYVIAAMLVPGFVATGFFIAARKSRLDSIMPSTSQTISPSPTPLERTGRLVKSVCFVIGVLIVLSMVPNLFFGDFGAIRPSDYPYILFGLTGVALIFYSFKK